MLYIVLYNKYHMIYVIKKDMLKILYKHKLGKIKDKVK